jgi:hypothetical protein
VIEWGLDPDRQDLVRIAARLTGALVTGLLLGWTFRRARRGEARREGASDVLVLEYGPALRGLFPVLAVGFGAVYGVATLLNPAQIEEPAAKLFWPLVLIEGLSLVGVLETWGVRIELSQHGLRSRSPWTGRRQLAWVAIEAVTFSESWQWFVVRGTDGTRIYLHVLLPGLGTFRAHVRARVAPDVYRAADPYLRRLSTVASGGRAPG